MATKALTAARAKVKQDPTPNWDNVDTLTANEFSVKFREALRYYNLESSGKELKSKIIDWMGRSGYNRDTISAFKKTKDSRCGVTMGAIAACLIKGMPETFPGFNQNRNAADWLRAEITKVIESGKFDVEPVEEVKTAKIIPIVPNIQDRIRDQAVQMSEEIDVAIDTWGADPEAFDPKAFKMVSLLRGKGAKAAQARYIKSFFERNHNELLELSSGEADEQLREGYKFASRKNIKKLIDFYESIKTACDTIIAEAKVLKKPRKAKIKPAEQIVAKVKFKVSDDKLGITSVPPTKLVGAQGAVVYNTKTRKIGFYIAKSSAGLGVKGTTLIEFTEKSVQRTLRKPEVQLKEFKEQNTQRRFETWFGKIKTTETQCNGRLNEDTIILKVY